MGSIEIGTLLGEKYRLVRQIGSGGMGHIFAVEHLHLKNRKMVLKLLSPEFVNNPVMVKRFIREAQAASAIGHPHIVDIQDIGQTENGTPFIVMEALEGETLGELIRRAGPIPPPRAISIALPILSALAAAHAEGIVHRDIKPANIYLSKDAKNREVVKLLDFGVCKLMTYGSGTVLTVGGQPGTIGYMAPEQAAGRDDIDERVDIWALGVVLYKMLTGNLPFSTESFEKFAQEITTAKAVPPIAEVAKDIPPQMADAIDTALAIDPAGRQSSITAFSSPLAGLVFEKMHAGDENYAYAASIAKELGISAPTGFAASPQASVCDTTDIDPLAVTVPSDADNEISNSSVEREQTSQSKTTAAPTKPRPHRVWIYSTTALLAAIALSFFFLQPGDAKKESTLEAPALSRKFDISVESKSDPAKNQPANSDSPANPVATEQNQIKTQPIPPAVSAAQKPAKKSSKPGRMKASSPSRRKENTPTSEKEEVNPPPAAATHSGFLSVRTGPKTEVFIDGEFVGTTPIIKHKLPTGQHSVECRDDTLGIKQTYSVEIDGGRHTSLVKTLSLPPLSSSRAISD